MADSVKFIFMTLIKVPVIIFVAFFIFNIFAFFFIYFKVLGLSYVVMQEVVENNYMTQSQVNQINTYFADIDKIPLASNTSIIVGLSNKTDSAGKSIPACYDKSTKTVVLASDMSSAATLSTANTSAIKRTQYGTVKTVGVHCDYTIVWPLSYNNSKSSNGKTATAVDGTKDNKKVNPLEIKASKDDVYTNNSSSGDTTTRGHKIKIPLNIYYTVPGLKYYADQK